MPYDEHICYLEAEPDHYPDHDTYAERSLAASVIHRAVLDLTTPIPCKNLTSWVGNEDIFMWLRTYRDAYEFLTGRGEMSKFWFQVLDLPYFFGTPEELKARLI